MKLTEKDFPVLDALGREVITTQRELADHAGISLGQVNYVIKSLLERGLVKIGNFTKSPKKISYVYRLTPKGLEAKSTLAAKFIISKLEEYHNIQDRLADRLTALANQQRYRIFFVGPYVVGDLLNTVIDEKKLNLKLVGQCKAFSDLADYDADFFDAVLLFEGNGKKLKEAANSVKIPLDKLTPFL
jgi:EPS-associated MarR family transcriptional regulator